MGDGESSAVPALGGQRAHRTCTGPARALVGRTPGPWDSRQPPPLQRRGAGSGAGGPPGGSRRGSRAGGSAVQPCTVPGRSQAAPARTRCPAHPLPGARAAAGGWANALPLGSLTCVPLNTRGWERKVVAPSAAWEARPRSWKGTGFYAPRGEVFRGKLLRARHTRHPARGGGGTKAAGAARGVPGAPRPSPCRLSGLFQTRFLIK